MAKKPKPQPSSPDSSPLAGVSRDRQPMVSQKAKKAKKTSRGK